MAFDKSGRERERLVKKREIRSEMAKTEIAKPCIYLFVQDVTAE